ncbi:MAG: hypothetical protein BGO49_05645 [Planctomycetales bacterium 71-10]|nr:MAG: hypothetical protein BGO49_05645 [Planctomycetales bacterium 71-10]
MDDAIAATARWLATAGARPTPGEIEAVLRWNARRLPEALRADFVSLTAIEYMHERFPPDSPPAATQDGRLIRRVAGRVRKRLVRELARNHHSTSAEPEVGIEDDPSGDLRRDEAMAALLASLTPFETIVLSRLDERSTQAQLAATLKTTRARVAKAAISIRRKLMKIVSTS